MNNSSNPQVGKIPSRIHSPRYGAPQSAYTTTLLTTAQTMIPHCFGSHTPLRLLP